jgi:3-hydroxyacyl-CoA dehydrogenase
MQQFAAVLKDEYIEAGNLGVLTGQGFYTYS